MPIRPRIFILSTMALCLQLGSSIVANANVLQYDVGMKSPPWAVNHSEDDTKLKEEFAEILLKRPHEPFDAAKAVTGDDEKLFGLVYLRSRSWPNDSYVKAHQQKLISMFGAAHFMPSREEIIHEWWYRVREKDMAGNRKMDNRDAIAASTLIGNMAGYLTKNANIGVGDDNSTTINQSLEVTFVTAEPMKNVIENKPKVIDNVVEQIPLGITFED